MAVIETIQHVRSVGKFELVSSGAKLPFAKLTLLYAENGRGKTTLAAILRSLSTGTATLILERRRLAAKQSPHIVIKSNAAAPFVFENGAWSSTFPELVIFDDAFVAENICSGIDIATEHRQNLHEWIVGAQGVALNNILQGYVRENEEHIRELKSCSDAIPAAVRGALTVDAFCALKANPKIAEDLQQAERNLAAAKSADAVKQQKQFDAIALPSIDRAAVAAILARDLPSLDAKAASRVQAHFAALGKGGETWIADGIHRLSTGEDSEHCPFCAQDLKGSPLIDHYRAYFSDAYIALKDDIAREISETQKAHVGDVPAAFERAVRLSEQTQQFWKDFTTVPAVSIDTAEVARAWKAAREAVINVLSRKQASPLEPILLSKEAVASVAAYEELRKVVMEKTAAFVAVNAAIDIVKEKAASADVAALSSDLSKLKVVAARHSASIAPLCKAYLDAKKAKIATEKLRDAARGALDSYRTKVFPAYENAINEYLEKFNAGFRLGGVSSVNTRAGSSCTYNVLINNVTVPLTATEVGEPSFRTTLSAGDRNTLALAFFFASLDQDPNAAQKSVVIDDPMTSLDEHRSLTTVQEMRRLTGKVAQVIVLSHSKPFLWSLWESSDKIARSAIKITRDHDGSTLETWDVKQDCVTLHDRRHAMVAVFVGTNNAADERAVASALRPILESFMRVAYPEDFPPESLLGPFLGVCQQRVGTPDEILKAADIAEVRDLLDYANRFHHDTNAAWETEIINDQQLQQFSRRTLKFARR